MDTALVQAAIREAIAAGVSRAPPMFPSAASVHDIDIVRASTTVEMSPAFDEYLADLGRDPELRLFDGTFATAATGHSVAAPLSLVASALLAEAISSGSVAETVERFRSYVEKKRAPAIAVMAVSGVKSKQEVPLGPHIRLIPMTSLPPSVQRGAAIGQPSSPFAERIPI